MSFWQSLVKSYDANAKELAKEFPLSTTSISNNREDILIVKIDGEGNFLEVGKIDKKKKDESLTNIVFPVTEESMGRSSGICPHPIYDQYDYLSGSGKKFEAYIEQLKEFAESDFATTQIKAIYSYMYKRNLKEDLSNINLKGKTNILFEVQIPGENQTKTWKNKEMFQAWHSYYLSKKQEGNRLDFITGEIQTTAKIHPKKISNGSGNAKLISANDSSNYTYRGMFAKPEEALSIGYDSSQKAHQFLRFLIRDRGITCGKQVIITYEIEQNKNEMKIVNPLKDSKNLLELLSALQENSSEDKIASVETGKDFAEALKKAILLGKESKALTQHKKTAIVILDAATTGRLSVKYYQELDNEDYLEKIADWHGTCKFNFTYTDEKHDDHIYIKTPSVDSIIQAVYGKPKGENDEGYEKLKKNARERLIHCIFDGEAIPRDYVHSAVRRASAPQAYEGNFDELVNVTCALVRKYEKEVYGLSLERDNTERAYLYGRLLGAADRFESYINYKAGIKRSTIAMRYMNAFSRKPFKTWQIIEEALVPYTQRLKGQESTNIAYAEMEEIKNMFPSVDEFKKNEALDGTYLLGYSCEKMWIKEEVKKLSKNKAQVEEEK
ncbi:MAG: type I-C CRISPR-associated protein Cas8c/Csd1 [Lactobacillales bacterium]|jgi:CRISPR-associated protein Csd1|nr:type I-C CRISPR-associated protein Cas8c/Csd1 [Lactobacillales bacterium]